MITNAPSAATPTAAPVPTAPATATAAAPGPAKPLPTPLTTFSYVRATAAGEHVDAPAYPFQLMPGAEWVRPDNVLYMGIGNDWEIALKVAHARAGVALSNQAQLIMKDLKDGAFYVTGSAHPLQQVQPDGTVTTTAMPTFIDGNDFAQVMKSVTVTRNDPDVQAVVGATGFIDLRTATTGSEQPFQQSAKS